MEDMVPKCHLTTTATDMAEWTATIHTTTEALTDTENMNSLS